MPLSRLLLQSPSFNRDWDRLLPCRTTPKGGMRYTKIYIIQWARSRLYHHFSRTFQICTILPVLVQTFRNPCIFQELRTISKNSNQSSIRSRKKRISVKKRQIVSTRRKCLNLPTFCWRILIRLTIRLQYLQQLENILNIFLNILKILAKKVIPRDR